MGEVRGWGGGADLIGSVDVSCADEVKNWLLFCTGGGGRRALPMTRVPFGVKCVDLSFSVPTLRQTPTASSSANLIYQSPSPCSLPF